VLSFEIQYGRMRMLKKALLIKKKKKKRIETGKCTKKKLMALKEEMQR